MTTDYAADVETAWKCERCHRLTRDNWKISEGWSSTLCRECRGFTTVTDVEAKAIAAAVDHEREKLSDAYESYFADERTKSERWALAVALAFIFGLILGSLGG